MNIKFAEIFLGLGIGAIVFGAVFLALQFRFGPEPPAGPLPLETKAATVLSEPLAIPAFNLSEHHGNPFTEKSLQGQWTFLFFGYTYCPDICPSTLILLNQVDKLLSEKKILPHPKFIFISIDPDRDTLKQLGDYVTYFNQAFLGITGDKTELEKLTRPLGIAYARDPKTASSENYIINHSASILLVEPEGQLRALISPPHDAEEIAKDYKTIIEVVGRASVEKQLGWQ
jgi:protein SCO1